MAKTLIIARHAQASETYLGQKDIQRTLTTKGESDALRAGFKMKSKGVIVNHIVTSTAERAWQTARTMAQHLDITDEEIVKNPELYQASVGSVMGIINAFDNKTDTVLLVGHNPTVSFLVEYLTNENVGDLSPCTFVRIDFPFDSWDVISQHSGMLKWTERAS